MARTPEDRRRDRAKGPVAREIAHRYSEGLPTAQDDVVTQRWRRSAAYPGWLPRSRAVMGDDTAAILSQLPAPSGWQKVSITPRRNEPGYTVTVTLKGGRGRRVVTLPSRDNVSELAELLEGASRGTIGNRADRARLKRYWTTGRGNPYRIKVNVHGYGPKEPERPLPEPRGKALPPRKPAKKAPATKAKKAAKKVAKKRPTKKAARIAPPSLAPLQVERLVASAVKAATRALEQENAALRRQLAAQGRQLARIERMLTKLTEGS